MNRKYIAVISSLVLVLCVAVCFGIIKSGNSDINTDRAENAEKAFVRVTESTAEPSFEVRRNGEKIGVYESVTDELYMSIDTYIFTLPETDRGMLENGFEVEKGEIIHVVEDYTG